MTDISSGTNSAYRTTQECAEEWRVDPNTVRRWVKQGLLPGIRIGRQYRIPVGAKSPGGTGIQLEAAN